MGDAAREGNGEQWRCSRRQRWARNEGRRVQSVASRRSGGERRRDGKDECWTRGSFRKHGGELHGKILSLLG